MSSNGILTPEKARRTSIENAAASVAVADPVPGAAAKAFPLPDVHVGPFNVRAPRAYDWPLLKAINSPINRMIEDVSNPLNEKKDLDITDEEGWVICWQFTRPCRDVDAIYRKGGKDAMIVAATETIGCELDGTQVSEIIRAVIQQIGDTWSTALKYSQEEGGEGQKPTFFREQRT